MLVTSAPAMIAGGIGNLLLTPSDALLAEHRIIERPPNGLGDLTAAVYLARLLAGQPAAKALQSTTASVFEILARTAKRGGDELQLETDAREPVASHGDGATAPSRASRVRTGALERIGRRRPRDRRRRRLQGRAGSP